MCELAQRETRRSTELRRAKRDPEACGAAMSTRGRDGGAGSSSDEQSRMLFPPQPGEPGCGRDADAVDLVSDEEDAEVAAAAASASSSASTSSAPAASSVPPPPLAVGDWVWAKWTNGSWYSGMLSGSNADRT